MDTTNMHPDYTNPCNVSEPTMHEKFNMMVESLRNLIEECKVEEQALFAEGVDLAKHYPLLLINSAFMNANTQRGNPPEQAEARALCILEVMLKGDSFTDRDVAQTYSELYYRFIAARGRRKAAEGALKQLEECLKFTNMVNVLWVPLLVMLFLRLPNVLASANAMPARSGERR